MTGGALVRNYDPATRAMSLPLFGTVLQIGENEGGGGTEGNREKDRDND